MRSTIWKGIKMKRYFIVADCHSFYSIMKRTLDAAGFDANNPEHIFVSLGDLFDRGDESAEMLRFVSSLPEERKILIMGNHELLMQKMLNTGCFYRYDISNGTVKTACDITGETNPYVAIQMMRLRKDWAEYYHSCKFYVEMGNCIFTHGWIPDRVDWRSADTQEWEDATWLNGMKQWADGLWEDGKTIFCGHWHTSWGHSRIRGFGVEFPSTPDDKVCFCPFIDEGIIAMDACTALSEKVNCITLDEDELTNFPLV